MALLTYQEVFDEITRYYPLGIKESNPEYFRYPGIMLLQDLCDKKIELRVYGMWKEFVKGFKGKGGKLISTSAESPLFDPSYTGKILLSKKKIESVVYTREIHFHLSVLTPFYTVYGLDRVILNLEHNERLDFEPIIYISPYDIYEKWFDMIRKKIETTYEGCRFVRFSLLRVRPDSLSVPGAQIRNLNASVFQALFTARDITCYKTKGNIGYE